jgi:exosortase A
MLLLIAFLISIVAFFWDTFAAMAAVWSNSENFSHGWLIAPISLWLIWQQRNALKSIRWEVSIWGLFALAICAAMWLSGELARVSVVKQIAAVLAIPSAVLLFAGWGVFRVLQFPLLFLITMVPGGEGLTPMLMEHTASVLVWAVQATGIPIYREGMHFSLPTGRWSVVEACSGLRYVIAASILALLFVYLNFSSWKRKLFFIVACLVLSVLANWMRAYMIVMVGHLSHMRYGVGDDHVIYGWVFFGIVMALIFWVGSKFGDKDLKVADVQTRTALPIAIKSVNLSLKLTVFVAALALIGLVVNAPSVMRNYEPNPLILEGLQDKLSAKPSTNFPVETAILQPIVTKTLSLADDVFLEAEYFARQDKNQDMLGYGQRLLPEMSTRFVELENVKEQSVPLDFGKSTRHLVKIGDQQYLLLHWYIVGKASVGSPYAAKVVRLFNIGKGDGDHSFSVVLATKVQHSPADALKKLAAQALRVNDAFKAISLK